MAAKPKAKARKKLARAHEDAGLDRVLKALELSPEVAAELGTGNPVITRIEALLKASEDKLAESLKGDLPPHQAAAMIRAFGEQLDRIARLTGEMPTNQTVIVNYLAGLGVRDDAELRRVVDIGRAVESVTPAEGVQDAILVLRDHLAHTPGDGDRVRQELGL